MMFAGSCQRLVKFQARAHLSDDCTTNPDTSHFWLGGFIMDVAGSNAGNIFLSFGVWHLPTLGVLCVLVVRRTKKQLNKQCSAAVAEQLQSRGKHCIKVRGKVCRAPSVGNLISSNAFVEGICNDAICIFSHEWVLCLRANQEPRGG